MSQVEIALFATLASLPLSGITTILAVLLILIFFITSADSASYVLGAMTSNGTINPKMWVKLVWGFLIAGTASVLLLSGGGGLAALQTASIITALPFGIIMVIMIVSILIMFNEDLKILNQNRTEKQVSKFQDKIQKNLINKIKKQIDEENVSQEKEEFYENLKEEIYEDLKEEIYQEVKEEIKESLLKEKSNNK